MGILQVKESCLYVKDLDKTQSFYTEVLDLPVISRKEDRHVFFNAGTSVLLCFIPDSTKVETELPPHWSNGPAHLAFEVELSEYEQWMQKVKDADVEIIHEQGWGNDYKSFYFRDPDGHVLEMVPEGMWEYLAGS